MNSSNFETIQEIIFKMERHYGDYCQIVENKCYLDRSLKNGKINRKYYNAQVALFKIKEIEIEAKFDVTFKKLYTNNEIYNIKLSFILQLIKTYPKDYKQWISLLCEEINKNNVNYRLTI